jgi:predicted membrane-bound spermidine synthase
MEFTPRELKLIGRLRKLDRQWSWMRWLLLFAGLLCAVDVALYTHTLFSLAASLKSSQPTSPDTVLAIAIFFPKWLLMLGCGTWALGKALADWNGNASRMLLLRLLDAQQNQTTNDRNPR